MPGDIVVLATARVVREELTHVGRLVDDLLALARAPLDDFVVPRDVPLERFFADLELRLDGLRLSLVETLPAPERTIRADPARLQQALLNLAVNATVHSPPGTRVIVSAAVTGPRVVFTVADEGPGIPDGVVERVLEPFVRAETNVGPNGRHDSSGLGLAVVDVVARAHGGHVVIEAGPEGTTVSLDLPALIAPTVPRPPAGGGAAAPRRHALRAAGAAPGPGPTGPDCWAGWRARSSGRARPRRPGRGPRPAVRGPARPRAG